MQFPKRDPRFSVRECHLDAEAGKVVPVKGFAFQRSDLEKELEDLLVNFMYNLRYDMWWVPAHKINEG